MYVRLQIQRFCFFSKTDHRLVGSYTRDYSPEYKNIEDPSLLSPTDKAFRRGYDALAEEFKSHGYALDNILNYLKLIYKTNEGQSEDASQETATYKSPQMILYRKSMGLFGLCKRHGAKIVDKACKTADSYDRADDYEFIKKCIKSELRDINEGKKVKRKKQKAPSSKLDSTAVMSRSSSYYN